MKSKRILQLATSTGGGAGIAARRLHEALIEIQEDSTLLTLTDKNRAIATIEIDRSKIDKLKSSAVTAIQSFFFQSSDQLLTPISKNSVTEKSLKLSNYNIVHIHAYYNLLSTSRIIKLCKSNPEKKFFLTLHDERFLTGGCHYSQKCTNIINECRKCPQATILGKFFAHRDYKKKLETLNNLQNLKLISPSSWLRTAAANNPATSELKCYVVRNPIPQEFFEVQVSSENKDVLRIAFISAHLNTRMKGLHTLISAMNLIAEKGYSEQFEMLLVGYGEVPNFLDSRINFETTKTFTDKETAQILSNCHVLVVPSIQDNLPSTMIEAICAGLSVVGTKTGGIEEILNNYDQPTFKVGDSRELASELLGLLKSRNLPSRSQAIRDFSYSAVAKQMIEIYENG